MPHFSIPLFLPMQCIPLKQILHCLVWLWLMHCLIRNGWTVAHGHGSTIAPSTHAPPVSVGSSIHGKCRPKVSQWHVTIAAKFIAVWQGNVNQVILVDVHLVLRDTSSFLVDVHLSANTNYGRSFLFLAWPNQRFVLGIVGIYIGSCSVHDSGNVFDICRHNSIVRCTSTSISAGCRMLAVLMAFNAVWIIHKITSTH